MTPFQDTVSTEYELRELLGHPSRLVQNKVIDRLDGHCRSFIASSPLLFLATADATGCCDVSPRGDCPGFVQVLDDSHLLIPERLGNRRLDSFRNILSNAHVGLIFLIPGLDETLRVNGRACIVKDSDLLTSMAVRGRVPTVAIGVTVEECYVHCAKAFRRSQTWHSSSWPESVPDVAQILADHVQLEGYNRETVAQSLDKSYRETLY
ncbi:pyridoxamine 5'-phosphate oxidase family protein [Sulfobacillus harzensis]|uniref:Pyridoxamine 5'-phosphate oxidase family protein n=1 Tax=Sulfobacillus harzensis TaxID=2729629 RepID=A0A7Y0L4H2_9FIRM|nr:pyridoxamine 5'-phosphate oxidase family protein [Sulfobacillus harzensis]NMP23157.1 pyridoxamine 5'-phosphate oxidase family protein [Sulfobacillus harzensis]